MKDNKENHCYLQDLDLQICCCQCKFRFILKSEDLRCSDHAILGKDHGYCENYEKEEFIILSYTGEYPNLCSGKLNIIMNGESIVISNFLESGGTCAYNPNRNYEFADKDPDDGYEITTGPWKLYEEAEDLEQFTKEQRNYILEWVNKNIKEGCCGGCI
jgi:hypothetical protein